MKRPALLLITTLAAGCALYSDVSVTPLLLQPKSTWNPTTDVGDLVAQGEFARAASYAQFVEQKRPTVKHLAAIGEAELACGRLDSARRLLRSALDLKPFRTELAQIAWSLSQTEYLANNFAASREWAQLAADNGLLVKKWHMQYLDALATVRTYEIAGVTTTTMPMEMGKPDVPRLTVELNGTMNAMAVIDTGAVLSIISESVASRLGAASLGNFEGEFYGLLGEPISVRFALLESMSFGDLIVRRVPVAVMPDSKMSFLVTGRERFNIDVLLGANLLKEFRAEFSYRDATAKFSAVSRRDEDVVADQNMFFVGFRPLVHATINRRGWYPFVLDTGSEITYLNQSALEASNIRSSPRFHGALLQGLGGSQKRGEKVQDVEIGVDRWAGKFRNLPLYSSEQTNAVGILGQNFLKNFRVIIDFGQMKLELQRESFRIGAVRAPGLHFSRLE